jgi:hypothetical protein
MKPVGPWQGPTLAPIARIPDSIAVLAAVEAALPGWARKEFRRAYMVERKKGAGMLPAARLALVAMRARSGEYLAQAEEAAR